MKTATKVTVGVMLLGLLWAVASIWIWALFGMNEQVGTAHTATASILFFSGFVGTAFTA